MRVKNDEADSYSTDFFPPTCESDSEIDFIADERNWSFPADNDQLYSSATTSSGTHGIGFRGTSVRGHSSIYVYGKNNYFCMFS